MGGLQHPEARIGNFCTSGRERKGGKKEDEEWRNASEEERGERGGGRQGRQKMHPARGIML